MNGTVFLPLSRRDRGSGVVYQETSLEFRVKVQQALELLNSEVAAWWRSPGVDGLVRSYDQDDYPGSSPHHSFCLVENGQAIVVVDRRFTAGRTAQGIIYLAHSGLFCSRRRRISISDRASAGSAPRSEK